MSGLRGSLLITCLSKIYVIIVGQVKALSEGIWKNYFIAAIFYNLLKTCVPAFLPNDFNDEDLALAISRTAKMTVNNELIKKAALLDFLDNRSYTLPYAAFLIE